jgi:hypothetical protein
MIAIAVFTVCASTRMFMPRRPVSPATPSTAARSQVPMMPLFDFGTANFQAPEGKKNSFFIGVDRDGAPQPNKFSKSGDDVVNVNPFAILLAGAPIVLLLSIILSLFLLAPGTQTPFKFLDGFYPPRVEELKVIATKKEKFEAEQKAAAAKLKAEKERKEAEAAAKAAAAAKEAAAKEAAAKPAAAAAKK